MAKINQGVLGGFSGTIGPVIGYQWRGRWCMRTKPRTVLNPRTEAQQAHRMVFRDMVQLAGQMKEALRQGLHTASLEAQMTECNLFVKLNKECFGEGGVDYEGLVVSKGSVAPVDFKEARRDEHGAIHVRFERNPQHMRANAYDEVYLFVYCPAHRRGILSLPVHRHTKTLSLSLPTEWEGLPVHCYGFVTDYAQRASNSSYITLETSEEASTEGVFEDTVVADERARGAVGEMKDNGGDAHELDASPVVPKKLVKHKLRR